MAARLRRRPRKKFRRSVPITSSLSSLSFPSPTQPLDQNYLLCREQLPAHSKANDRIRLRWRWGVTRPFKEAPALATNCNFLGIQPGLNRLGLNIIVTAPPAGQVD